MAVFAQNEQVTVHHGEVVSALGEIAPETVATCVTSPPYFSLRDYGTTGQVGLEPVPDEYVYRLVRTFRAVRRVLREDGTVWLNLGDSYCRNPAKGQHKPKVSYAAGKQQYLYRKGGGRASATFDLKRSGLKEKDLIGIPWRVALALQQPWLRCAHCRQVEHQMRWARFRDRRHVCPTCMKITMNPSVVEPGWYLRADVIWNKPNGLPNSVRDRPVTTHEYVFLLAKNGRYAYDAAAIREPSVDGKMRARRTVWSVNTASFKQAHFAVFPPALIRPMILAGAAESEVVLDPFFGSGTTGVVATELGRRAVGIDINLDYCRLAAERLGLTPLEAGAAHASSRITP